MCRHRPSGVAAAGIGRARRDVRDGVRFDISSSCIFDIYVAVLTVIDVIIIIYINRKRARARGYDLLGPAYLGGQGFGYGGRCEEEVV